MTSVECCIISSLEEETRLQFIHLCTPASASQSFDEVVNNRKSWWSQVTTGLIISYLCFV